MTCPPSLDQQSSSATGDAATGDKMARQMLIQHVLDEVAARISPVWPLQDYVAVNPFLGFSDARFLDAREQLRAVRDVELLMPRHYFVDLWRRGVITPNDIQLALEQCRHEYPSWYASYRLEMIINLLEHPCVETGSERRYFTIAESIDQHLKSGWNSHIINDITRYCAAHYDEGQAVWSNPWKSLSLYEAFQQAAQRSYRMDWLGIRGFRTFVAQLPPRADEALERLLEELDLPPCHWSCFLLTQLLTVAGWASYVKYHMQRVMPASPQGHDLAGLLAMRLTYDVALARGDIVERAVWRTGIIPDRTAPGPKEDTVRKPSIETLARYTLQVAAETAYRRKLVSQLRSRSGCSASSGRKVAQLVFCIDVRSERIRRHLEATSDALTTFGFAGFFGLALEYLPLGATNGTAQCPVLLKPHFRIRETILSGDDRGLDSAIFARTTQRLWRKVWKSFQTSSISCFSFVESLGMFYAGKLISDGLGWTRPVARATYDGVPRQLRADLGPELCEEDQTGIPLDARITAAESLLRNLGLTDSFARFVVFCGHTAEVVNNPYQASLDCGACGGHSGEPNARVAVMLLNDPNVRKGLLARGISVPQDTWFVAAVHNTTTDEIRLLETEFLPESHAREMTQLRLWTLVASSQSRLERALQFSGSKANDCFRRGMDWAEVRPEWGLAGNAAFIVAPRTRTAGLELDGRVFLHNYELEKDATYSILELIMTAPMIVTNWINLQYYASAVDNRAYGSGNKMIHNVVGQFGVLQGNGGDLMTGLPWQSVHDGTHLQHDPLRLLVLIEATRPAVQSILAKHPQVCDLASNGWLSLCVLEDDQAYRWTATGDWEREP
jgi:uncharacterized protein YbcC (UPF0753/DUF2309 family)